MNAGVNKSTPAMHANLSFIVKPQSASIWSLGWCGSLVRNSLLLTSSMSLTRPPPQALERKSIAPRGLHDGGVPFVAGPHLCTCLQSTGCFNKCFKAVYDTCESGEEFLDCGGNNSKDEVSVRPFDEKVKFDVGSVKPFPKMINDDDDDDDDDNFIAIYMYITRHTCNGMRFAPELLHSMLPTIQSFHPYST